MNGFRAVLARMLPMSQIRFMPIERNDPFAEWTREIEAPVLDGQQNPELDDMFREDDTRGQERVDVDDNSSGSSYDRGDD
ncbi:hypothetical protein Droror1_Dr00012529 [Drosera rotundifolia]